MQPPWLSEVPFTLPFELFAHTGKLWIQNDGASTQDEFHIKGVNWAGFQVDGCPHALWRTSVGAYVNHIVDNGFNAVRIPLSAPWVNGNWRATGNCGPYRNWRTAPGPLPACGSADDGLGLRRDRHRTSGEVSIDHVTTPPTPNSRLRRSRSRSRSPEPEPPEPQPSPSPSMPVAEGSRSLDAETRAVGDVDGAAMDRSTI